MLKIDQFLTIVPPPLRFTGMGAGRRMRHRDPSVLASPLEIRFCGDLTAGRGLGSGGAFHRSKAALEPPSRGIVGARPVSSKDAWVAKATEADLDLIH